MKDDELDKTVLLSHGSGGRAMHSLVRDVLGPIIGIKDYGDAATVPMDGDRGKGTLAFTTDSYVVSPLFFPGGDIGSLAVNGTVNDLAVAGASPLCLSLGLIIEEGFPMESLLRIAHSIREAADRAGVGIITADTKVVGKGSGDGIFINTSGIGSVREGVSLSPKRVVPGDRVILSGPIASHGLAVMAERNGLYFDPPVVSDTAALNGLVELMLSRAPGIRAMRDPTRGGLATTLCEMAAEAGLCIEIEEEKIPLAPQVRGGCELMGLDPLYVANEGVLVAFAGEDVSEFLLDEMRKHPLGRNSAIVGRVTDEPAGRVLLKTPIGGRRIVGMLQGEQLPRIC